MRVGVRWKKGSTVKKLRVIGVSDVIGYSPPGGEGKFVSRLLIDGESVGSSNLVLNHFTLFPGESTDLGSHPSPYEESYYILSGVGVLLLGGKTHDVSANTAIYIPAETQHKLTNVGNEPLEMLTVMPFHPVPGVNEIYDQRKREWGTSFRQTVDNRPSE